MPKTTKRECQTHGNTEFVMEGRGYYRCKKCRVAAVQKRRRKVKEQLVAEFGGKCAMCGYNRCLAALEFHHLDPTQKEFGVDRSVTRSIEKMRAEAKKCQLLCANCHAEVEDGFEDILG